MKICYLGNAASVHTVRWANYFADHGWGVDLITWHKPREGVTGRISAAIRVHRIFFPPHNIARYAALLEAARFIRKLRPDLLHAHYLGHFGILAGLYNRFYHFRPVVLTAWGSDVLLDARGAKARLIRDTLGRIDCVTCDADHMVGELVKLGAPRDKVRLINFGTDVKKFSPGPDDGTIRKNLGLSNSPVVISLRMLKPIYDVATLINAVPLVLKEVPEAKFVIGGDGDQRGYLENLSRSLGVSDSVKFVGVIPNDELPRYFAAADVYVSTSLSDAGLAASSAEAMASGLPVVISDFRDNRQWVEDGVSGYLFPLRDVEALATSVVFLLKNEGKRQELGSVGRKIIVERNNFDTQMAKMGDIYTELIERYRQ
jgi:glycosyltransferase involved in cell wall biosynthesis